MARDLSFLDHLSHLLDLERRAEEARFAAQKETLRPAERVAQGLALADLEASDETWGLGGRLLITFQIPKTHAPHSTGRLEPGASVQLSRRGPHGDTPPCRGVVSRRSTQAIEVAFDTPPPAFVRESRIWLELLPNDVTYQRAKAALATVRGMDSGKPRHRRDVLLGERPPRFYDPTPITPIQPLNPEQHAATARALGAQDFFLVHGPPGTGKSTVLVEIALQAVRQGQRVLMTAASNAAVDHLLDLCLKQGLRTLRVGHPARVAERLVGATLDARAADHPNHQLARELLDEAYDLLGYARRQRVQGRRRERFANAREAKKRADGLFDEARTLEKSAIAALFAEAQVVCATCTALAGRALRDQTFDLVLLDEATQAIEPLALLAFAKAERWVLAGDPQQLAPTVLSLDAGTQGLAVSLFERLLQDHGPGPKALLREQYRMHATIMTFASETTYDGALRAHPSVASHTLADYGPDLAAVIAPPLMLLDTAGKGYDEERVHVGVLAAESQQNPGEARLLAARVQELLAAGLKPEQIGIIAPYSAQVSLLRATLLAFVPTQTDLAGLEIDTVDAFQGREKEAILLSFTRANSDGTLGFLTDVRRLNVALTRARRHVFAVGDSGTLASSPYLQSLLTYTEAHKGYRSAWEWPDPDASPDP